MAEHATVARGRMFEGASGFEPGHYVSIFVRGLLACRGHLDMSPIASARYGLNATADAIVKSIDHTDGKIMVKPN